MKKLLNFRCAFLVVILIAVLGVIGCSEKKDKESGIPLTSDGCPQHNVISINDVLKEFSYQFGDDGPVEDTVSFDGVVKDDTITVFLPEGLPIHEWIAEENVKGMELVQQESYECSAKPSDVEGISQKIQKFTFKVLDKDEVDKIIFYKKNKDFEEQIFELVIEVTVK